MKSYESAVNITFSPYAVSSPHALRLRESASSNISINDLNGIDFPVIVLSSTGEVLFTNSSLDEPLLPYLRNTRFNPERVEKLAALGELVAGVAHEINNPLAVIGGLAQLLERHADERVQDDARSIRRMTDRATRIVRSLLNFAREHGADHRGRATLRPLLEETLVLLAHRLATAKIDIVLSFKDEDAPLWVNVTQIQQVILNLITNAEHALRDIEVKTIQITTYREGEFVALKIQDSGTGIPPEALPRIFEPFFTTKEIGEGTGMGLSICRNIAEVHRGTLSVASPPGDGATFVLRLPVEEGTPLS